MSVDARNQVEVKIQRRHEGGGGFQGLGSSPEQRRSWKRHEEASVSRLE